MIGQRQGAHHAPWSMSFSDSISRAADGVKKGFGAAGSQGTVFKEAAKLAIRRLAVDPFIFVSS